MGNKSMFCFSKKVGLLSILFIVIISLLGSLSFLTNTLSSNPINTNKKAMERDPAGGGVPVAVPTLNPDLQPWVACKEINKQWYTACNACSDKKGLGPGELCNKVFPYVEKKEGKWTDIQTCMDKGGVWDATCGVCVAQANTFTGEERCRTYPLNVNASTIKDDKACKLLGYQWYGLCGKCSAQLTSSNETYCGLIITYKDNPFSSYKNIDECSSHEGGAWNGCGDNTGVCVGPNNTRPQEERCATTKKELSASLINNPDVCLSHGYQWYGLCGRCSDKKGLDQEIFCGKKLTKKDSRYFKYTDPTTCMNNSGAWQSCESETGVCVSNTSNTDSGGVRCAILPYGTNPLKITDGDDCEGFGFQWYGYSLKCSSQKGLAADYFSTKKLIHVTDFTKYTSLKTCNAKSGVWEGTCNICVDPSDPDKSGSYRCKTN